MTTIPRDVNGSAYPATYQGTIQKVAYTAAAGTSNAVGDNTSVVRLIATTDCYYKIGAAPTATANDSRLTANTIEYRGIKPGEKVSAIRVSVDGTLEVEEGGN